MKKSRLIVRLCINTALCLALLSYPASAAVKMYQDFEGLDAGFAIDAATPDGKANAAQIDFSMVTAGTLTMTDLGGNMAALYTTDNNDTRLILGNTIPAAGNIIDIRFMVADYTGEWPNLSFMVYQNSGTYYNISLYMRVGASQEIGRISIGKTVDWVGKGNLSLLDGSDLARNISQPPIIRGAWNTMRIQVLKDSASGSDQLVIGVQLNDNPMIVAVDKGESGAIISPVKFAMNRPKNTVASPGEVKDVYLDDIYIRDFDEITLRKGGAIVKELSDLQEGDQLEAEAYLPGSPAAQRKGALLLSAFSGGRLLGVRGVSHILPPSVFQAVTALFTVPAQGAGKGRIEATVLSDYLDLHTLTEPKILE